MPYTASATATATLDPDAITTLAEADDNIADVKWRGTAGGTDANRHASISSNVIEAVIVTDADAADATGAVIAAVADAIDLTAVAASTIASGWAADAEAVTGTVGDAAFGNWIKAALAAGGTVTIKCESEVIGVGAADGTAISSLTRGAEGTTAATHADTTAVTLYVGTTCTTIPLDDPSVWGTPSATNPITLICGTEQMRVTAGSIDGTNDFLVATRGFDSTTAALHADNAAVTQYIDESTVQFDVDDATTILVGNHLKIATGGTEEMKVTAKSTNRLTVTRGYASTTPAVIADGAAIWKVYGDDVLATEYALSDIPLEQRGASVSSLT